MSHPACALTHEPHDGPVVRDWRSGADCEFSVAARTQTWRVSDSTRLTPATRAPPHSSHIAVVPSRLTQCGSWHVERTRGTAVEEGARTGGVRTPYIEAAGEEERERQREKGVRVGKRQRHRQSERASERRPTVVPLCRSTAVALLPCGHSTEAKRARSTAVPRSMSR